MTARSILVPYDFSPPSERALDLARRLHRSLRAAVTLLHVVPDPMDAGPRPIAWLNDEERARQREFLRGELGRVAREVFGPDEQTVRLRVETGRVVDRVLHTAVETGADLVVVGAAGKGAVERALLGSATLELLRRSPIPVLTVH